MSKKYFHETEPYRQQWSSGRDFVYVNLVHAFKMDLVTWVLPFMFLRVDAWSFALYIFCLAIFVVPIFLLQSYLGQFSSSGYISVFRIAPILKGIGYLSLVLNYVLICYQSIFVGIPLLFLWNTFRRPLPWSCEAPENWAHKAIKAVTLCTAPFQKGPHFIGDVDIPSVLYLRSHFQPIVNERLAFSWHLFVFLLVVWVMVYGIVLKRPAAFGKIIGFLVVTSIVLLFLCVFRSVYSPYSWNVMRNYFEPNFELGHWPQLVPVTAAITFASGWGSTISMASFNHFNASIIKYSWIVCVLQVAVMFLLGMFTYMMEFDMVASNNMYLKGIFYKQHWEIILSMPSAIAGEEFPQLWSIIIFSMLFLAGLTILATQLYSLVTALLDEFPSLHTQRPLVLQVVVVTLVITSSFFCFDHTETFFNALSTDALFTQTALNLLLLLAVLWIYGREHFQSDFEFMLGLHFRTTFVYILRFITPIVGLFVLYFCYQAMVHQHSISTVGFNLIAVLFMALPWFLIPGFIVWKLLQTTGPLLMRFRRICKPMNWYPQELDDRQGYAVMQGDIRLVQQLREMRDHKTVL